MSGSPVTGAVPVARCRWCRRMVVPCTAPACIGWQAVHLMSRLHKCGNGLTLAYAVQARTRGAA